MTAQSSSSAQTAAALRIADQAEDVRGPVEHDTLAAALVAALSDLTVVHTGRSVNTGTYSYDYADLGDVVKLTRPVLARHGLVALTPVHAHGNGLACTVTFLHESGERMDCEPFPFPHGANAQATGSMVTYHRRYALVAALGMAAGDDDDGATAAPRQAEPPKTSTSHPLRVECMALEGGDKLWAHFLGQSSVKEAEADALLAADEGWRKWLSDAIAAHKPAGTTE